MADILWDTQSVPVTLPTAGKVIPFIDAGTGKLGYMDSTGRVFGSLSRNDAVASQGPGFAVDTYVAGSGLLIPTFGMKVGQQFKWTITLSKTAAGVAGAIFTIRSGPNQSTADTARLTLTGGVQTAVVDNGHLFVTAQVRNVAAAGVIAGGASFAKTQPGTAGLGGSIDGVSGTFDNTAMQGLYVGLSINGGLAAAWTITSVTSELIG